MASGMVLPRLGLGLFANSADLVARVVFEEVLTAWFLANGAAAAWERWASAKHHLGSHPTLHLSSASLYLQARRIEQILNQNAVYAGAILRPRRAGQGNVWAR